MRLSKCSKIQTSVTFNHFLLQSLFTFAIAERIAESMLSSDRNFWDEVKRIRSISVVSSKTVDGISDASQNINAKNFSV